jgi:hypothetical protein
MNLQANIGQTWQNLNFWMQDPVYPHMLHSSTGYRTTMVGPCSEFTDPGARFIMKRDSSYRWASGPDVSPIEFPQQPMVASATSYGQCFNSAAALPWGNAPTEAPPTQQQQQPDPFTPSNVFNTSSLIEIDWRLIAAAVLVLITILTSRS